MIAWSWNWLYFPSSLVVQALFFIEWMLVEVENWWWGLT